MKRLNIGAGLGLGFATIFCYSMIYIFNFTGISSFFFAILCGMIFTLIGITIATRKQ